MQLFLLVCLLVAISVLLPFMPHLHSVDARRTRRERALARGFVQPRRREEAFVEIPEKLAKRVRTISRSLAVHDHHNQVTGQVHHFARHAALAAAPPASELKPVLQLHRVANKAKHQWADVDEDEYAFDPWLAEDPWSTTSSPSPCRVAAIAHEGSGGQPHDDFYSSAGASVVCPRTTAEGCAPNVCQDRGVASAPTIAVVDLADLLSRLAVVEHKVEIAIGSSNIIQEHLPHLVTNDTFKDVTGNLTRTFAECVGNFSTMFDDKLSILTSDFAKLVDLQSHVDSMCDRMANLGAIVVQLQDDIVKLVAAPASVAHQIDECPSKSTETLHRRSTVEQAEATSPAVNSGPRPTVLAPCGLYGMTVRIFGLRSATQWNDKFGVVQSFEEASSRFIVLLDHQSKPIKILPQNVEFPATCPSCMSGVISCGCFACGFGLDPLPGVPEDASASSSFPQPSSSDANAKQRM